MASMGQYDYSVELTTPLEGLTRDAVCQKGVLLNYKLSVRFYVNIIFVPAFVLFGIVGNILSIVITNSGQVNFGFPSTKLFIRALAVADISYLLGATLFQTLRTVQFDSPWLAVDVFPQLYRYVWPYMASVQTTETWLVVAIAVDRYIAVSRPLKAIRLCTKTMACVTIAVILTSSIAFNIPHWLEFNAESKQDPCTGRETVSIEATRLFESLVYQVTYWSVLTMIFRFSVPLIVLLVLTARLIATLRTAAINRAQLTLSISTQGARVDIKKARESDQVTKVLMSVVVVFILCETIEFFMHLLQTLRWTWPAYEKWENADVQVSVNTIGNLTLVISASVNFVLYCAFAKRFRQQLTIMLCGCYPNAGTMETSGRAPSLHNLEDRTNTAASYI